MNLTIGILLALLIATFLIGIAGSYLCPWLVVGALDSGSQQRMLRRSLWLCSCGAFSLLSWFFYIALVVAALYLVSVQWMESNEGKLVGAGILLATFSRAVWDMMKRAPDAYWEKVRQSLNIAIPQSGKQRTCFNSEQAFLKSSSPEERRRALVRVLQCSNKVEKS